MSISAQTEGIQALGSNVTIWVEVETTVKTWRESYGVTGPDALENVEVNAGESLTGKYTYNVEEEADELALPSDERHYRR